MAPRPSPFTSARPDVVPSTPGTASTSSAAIERYVRESQLAVVNAGTYLTAMGGYAVLRVFADVAHQRAALAAAAGALLVAVWVKVLLLGPFAHRVPALAASLVACLLLDQVLLWVLVTHGQGTLPAQTLALLGGIVVLQVVEIQAARRG